MGREAVAVVVPTINNGGLEQEVAVQVDRSRQSQDTLTDTNDNYWRPRLREMKER